MICLLSLMKEFKTDFEFKDSRNYVNSATLLEQLCRFIYESFYPEDNWEMPQIDAKFHKEVLFNGRFLVSEDNANISEYSSASASFRFYDKGHSIMAVFTEDKEANVVQRIKTSYSVEDIIMERDFSATSKIGCNNRIAFTENIIEANKRVHLLTLKDRGTNLKVINLYMKGFPVYHYIEECDYLLLKIENISVRPRDSSLATLNSLYFPQLQSERFEMAYIVEGL